MNLNIIKKFLIYFQNVLKKTSELVQGGFEHLH